MQNSAAVIQGKVKDTLVLYIAKLLLFSSLEASGPFRKVKCVFAIHGLYETVR